jgi:hypothetical protein
MSEITLNLIDIDSRLQDIFKAMERYSEYPVAPALGDLARAYSEAYKAQADLLKFFKR